MASAAEQAQQEQRDLWDSDSNVQQLSHDELASLINGGRDKSTVLVMYAPWCQYSQVYSVAALLRAYFPSPGSIAVLFQSYSAFLLLHCLIDTA